jgi:hypothetical protein
MPSSVPTHTAGMWMARPANGVTAVWGVRKQWDDLSMVGQNEFVSKQNSDSLLIDRTPHLCIHAPVARRKGRYDLAIRAGCASGFLTSGYAVIGCVVVSSFVPPQWVTRNAQRWRMSPSGGGRSRLVLTEHGSGSHQARQNLFAFFHDLRPGKRAGIASELGGFTRMTAAEFMPETPSQPSRSTENTPKG